MTSVEFLKKFHPNRSWILTAIAPDRKGIETKGFLPGQEQEAEAAKWISRWNEKRNLYFSVAEVINPEDKKAERENIEAVHWLHVDIDAGPGDLIKELDRIKALVTTKLPEGVPKPTCMVFSGGGYQAFWKLKQPIQIHGNRDAAEEAARYNKALEIKLGGDHCSDVSRIMRLPGTLNIPDAKKKAKGRVRIEAKVLSFTNTAYVLSEFVQAADVKAGDTVEVEIPRKFERLNSVDDLKTWEVPDRVKAIIVQGHDPDEPKDGDNSRSAWLFDACCNLVRCEVPNEVIYSIITDPGFKISASVLEASNSHKYALKQIRSAIEKVSSDELDFSTDKNGKPNATQENVRIAIKKLGRCVAFDEFARRETLDGHYLDDATADALYLEIERRFGFRTPSDYFHKVLTTMARENSFHPVRGHLDGLSWDGMERLPEWLPTYLGADSNEYTRAVGEIVLIAAVRRVRQPGCKFDEMLILESEQGTAKSTVLATLAVRDDWFSDDLPLGADTKRIIESLAGRWIVEAADLKGMKRADADNLKSFLSRRIDRSRMAYGRRVEEHPRQCVIVGTTNDERYLKDATGNRRFWPVRARNIDLDALRRDIDQLWAEAAAKEAEGRSIRLPERLWSIAGIEQAGRKVLNPMTEQLSTAIGDGPGILDSDDAWKIVGKCDPGRRSQGDMETLGEALRELGFERSRRRREGRLTYCYIRSDGGKLDWFVIRTDSRTGTWRAGGNVPPDDGEAGNRLPF